MVTIYESIAGGTTWCWWVFSEIVRHLIEGNLIDRTAVPKLLGGAKIVGWCKNCWVVQKLLGGGKIAGWCFMGRGVLGWLPDAVGQVLFYEFALVQMGACLLVTTPEAFCTMIGLSCSFDSCWWCSVAPLLSIAEVNRVF